MSIAEQNNAQIERLRSAIADAYAACNEKYAIMPSSEIITNLASCIRSIQSGIDTSDATAGALDILEEKTAYVNGQLVTGKYRAMRYGMAESTVVEGCSWSTTQVRLACEFEPTCISVVFNSGSYANSRVIAAWAMGESAIVYHTKTSSGIARTQITSNVSSYWYYDSVNKQVVINSPTTSYLWSNNAYRYFLFK